MNTRLIALLLLVSYSCFADSSVDVVWSDQQGLFLSWVADQASWLEKISSGEMVLVGQDVWGPGVSVGLCSVGLEELVAVTASNASYSVPDTDKLALFRTSDLTEYASRDLQGSDFGHAPYLGVVKLAVLEGTNAPGALELFSYSFVDFMGGNDPTYAYWTSVSVDLSDTQALPFSDTLSLSWPSYYVKDGNAGFVWNSQGPNLFAFSDWNNGGGVTQPVTSVLCVTDEVDRSSRSEPPWWDYVLEMEVGSSPWPELMAEVLCFGSYLDGAVLLWSDTTEAIHFSSFTTSPSPDVTLDYSFAFPSRFCESAMSSDPTSQGILLAWHDETSPGAIRVRYYNGVWNPWSYIVAENVGQLVWQGISVSQGDGGYWVAWLCTGASEPDYVFVPLGDVQGTDDSEGAQPDLSLRCSPNPFSSGLAIAVEGLLPGTDLRCEVFDFAGRLVAVPFDSQWQSGTELSWDGRFGDGSICPSGTYLVRISAGSTVVTARAVLLR
jgi:hypothetical protein